LSTGRIDEPSRTSTLCSLGSPVEEPRPPEGSFVVTAGSFVVTAGSFVVTAGSFVVTAGSFVVTTGSFVEGGAFLASAGLFATGRGFFAEIVGFRAELAGFVSVPEDAGLNTVSVTLLLTPSSGLPVSVFTAPMLVPTVLAGVGRRTSEVLGWVGGCVGAPVVPPSALEGDPAPAGADGGALVAGAGTVRPSLLVTLIVSSAGLVSDVPSAVPAFLT
jgi:hypothetical protein